MECTVTFSYWHWHRVLKENKGRVANVPHVFAIVSRHKPHGVIPIRRCKKQQVQKTYRRGPCGKCGGQIRGP